MFYGFQLGSHGWNLFQDLITKRERWVLWGSTLTLLRRSASLQISGYSSSRILTFYFLTFILFLVFASLYYLFRRRRGGAVEKGKITSGHGCIRKRLANDSWVPGLFYFFSILGFLFNVFSNAVGAKTSVSDSYCMKKTRQPVVS